MIFGLALTKKWVRGGGRMNTETEGYICIAITPEGVVARGGMERVCCGRIPLVLVGLKNCDFSFIVGFGLGVVV